MDGKAEQIIKRRKKEYIRDTLIVIVVIAIVVASIILAVKLLQEEPASIVLYNENGEKIGSYSEKGDVEIPTKKGYSTAWVTESGKTYDSIEDALANGEVSIKQVLSPIEYTITLYLIGGQLDGSFGYEYHEAKQGQESLGDYYTRTYTVNDDTIELPSLPSNNKTLISKKGSNFNYWSNVNYIEKNFSVDNLKTTETKDIKAGNIGDEVFYAVWEDILCQVDIIGVGGRVLFTENVKESFLISETDLREKVIKEGPDGYDFIGFYKDEEYNTGFDFSKEVNETHISIFTKWNARTYTLTFKADGETLQTSQYKTGEAIEFFDYSTMLAPGMQLDCWTFNGKEFTATVMPAKNIILYPSTSRIPYALTWYVDSTRSATQTYYYGETPAAPTTLNLDKAEDEGYTYVFDGWSPTLTSVSENKTYTAQYRQVAKKFTYSIEVNDEEVVSPTIVDYDTTITFPSDPASYEKDGYEYIFDKWVIKDTNITPTKVTKDMVIVALFEQHLCSYSVSWKDKDGNTIKVRDNNNNLVDYLTIEYGTTIDLDLALNDDIMSYIKDDNGHNRQFTFKGWSIGGVFQNNPHNYKVVGETVIDIEYEDDSDKFTYILLYENGDEITRDTHYVGEPAELYSKLSGINRAKAADNTYTYTFIGWGCYKNNILTLISASDLDLGKDEVIELTEMYSETYIEYSITWNLDNGEEPVVAKYHYGETLHPDTDLENANKETVKASTVSTVYTFSHWNNTSDIVTKSTTYTAIYTEETRKYNYKFYNGSNLLLDNTINYNDTIVAPLDLNDYEEVDYSYEFDGWYKDVEQPSTKFTQGDKLLCDAIYYAKFNKTIRTYTYIFYSEDGSDILKQETQDYGTTIIKPTSPSKSATAQYTYTFAGWETSDSVPCGDNQTLVGDIEFYAVFTETIRQYTYTFHSEGNIVETQLVNYGTEVVVSEVEIPTKATVPNKYTYTFESWNTDENLTGNTVEGTITIVGNIDFYAKYTQTPIEHTYTFITGVGDPIVITKGYNESVTAPQAPEKEHYSFVSWGETVPQTMGEIDRSFTAQWSAINYHITYNLPTGASETTNIDTYSVETSAEDLVLKIIGDSQKTGYTLSGWKYQGVLIDSILDTGVYDNITIDAYFVANTYTVTYNVVKDPSVVTIANNSTTVTYDQTYGTLETPTTHGYTFDGWYSDVNYSNASKITSSTIVKITDNQTLYAKWVLTPYYVYGYIGDEKVAEFPFDVEHPVELTPYTNNNEYIFDNWYAENVNDPDVTTFTVLTTYSDTYGDIITNVYAIVKPAAMTIEGNTVTAYTGNASHVVIPRVWAETPITTIKANVFANNNDIERVDTAFITTIQDGAFEFCMNLANVDLSNAVTIGNRAFMGCEDLTSVDLSSAETIGTRAFAFSGITEVYLSDNLKTLGDYAFYGCSINKVHYSGTKESFDLLISNSTGNSNLSGHLVA